SGWSQDDSSDEAGLTLFDSGGEPAFRITCRRGARLAVNVPAFTPIGSEERLSFGSGGEAVALVTNTTGDKVRGGMTGEGPIPDELKRLIIAPMSASYGAQTSGPHAPPADTIAGPFLSACQEFQTAARVDATKPNPDTSPCLVQDGSMLRLSPMRAIGTEPFWNARTDGRCVTYSTPEDQQGTRIWTKVESGPMGPVWVGAFKGKPFVLAVQPAVGCSDGMSDKKYDWSAELTVEGEKRRGCAERP
ncbi:MAG TPA: hypothetical protein VFZ35_06325, partial [Sphingomicrobium sp.]